MKLELISEFKAHPRHAQAVLFTHDGRELATTGMDALVQIWSLPEFANARSFQGHEKSANAIALSPDGATAVTGSTDRTVMVWDWKSGEPLHTLTGHRNTVAAVEFSPNGDLAATSAYGGMVGLWEGGSDTFPAGRQDVLRDSPARLRQPLLLCRRRSSRTRPRCYGDFGQLPDRHQGNVRRSLLLRRRDCRGGKRRWPMPRLGGRQIVQ